LEEVPVPQQQVAIVSAGIVGLAHAWSAARRGNRVTLFERDRQANGASIRNFGIVWPIGQPAGELHDLAMVSRERWLELAKAANVWVNPCGSVHLAHGADEWAVLEEFHSQSAELGFDGALLSVSEVLARVPAANPERLHGGLISRTELGVNLRRATREIPACLSRELNVRLFFQTAVSTLETAEGFQGAVMLRTSSGERFRFDRVMLCSGTDFQTLFPETFDQSRIKRCKLQMMKTRPQPEGWRLDPTSPAVSRCATTTTLTCAPVCRH
jgi:FAD dependent oxidoreductase TIGR03364